MKKKIEFRDRRYRHLILYRSWIAKLKEADPTARADTLYHRAMILARFAKYGPKGFFKKDQDIGFRAMELNMSQKSFIRHWDYLEKHDFIRTDVIRFFVMLEKPTEEKPLYTKMTYLTVHDSNLTLAEKLVWSKYVGLGGLYHHVSATKVADWLFLSEKSVKNTRSTLVKKGYMTTQPIPPTWERDERFRWPVNYKAIIPNTITNTNTNIINFHFQDYQEEQEAAEYGFPITKISI